VSKPLMFGARVTGFQSADPPLLLRCVDDEDVALALTGVIERDSFSVKRSLGRSVATPRLRALPNTGPIRVHNVNFIIWLRDSPTFHSGFAERINYQFFACPRAFGTAILRFTVKEQIPINYQ